MNLISKIQQPTAVTASRLVEITSSGLNGEGSFSGLVMESKAGLVGLELFVVTKAEGSDVGLLVVESWLLLIVGISNESNVGILVAEP